MKKRYMILGISIVIMFVGFFLTCESYHYGNPRKTATDENRIMVILSGGADDLSWNMANIEGVRNCNNQMGKNIEYVENIKESNFEQEMNVYADKGYRLIIAVGSQFTEAVEAVAPKHKETVFCVINGVKEKTRNIVAVQPNENEASYIAALIAGSETQNGKFAVIGGYPNKWMVKLLDIYEKAAIQTASNRGFTDASSRRAYTNSWDDVDLGEMMTEQMVEDGADIVFTYANKAGLGCIEAAERNNAKVIGFCTDQTKINPDVVIASVVFDFGKLYQWIIEHYEKGELSNKKLYQIGMNEEMFYPVYTNNISSRTQSLVEKKLKKMKAGETPYSTEERKSYVFKK